MSSIRVIVAGSADAEAQDPTVAAALAAARATGARLHLVHAFAPSPLLAMTPAMDYVDAWGWEAYRASISERFAAAVALRCPGAVLHVVAGTADRVLLEVAAEQGADLVLVGATRRGPLARALLGTTAQRVLRGARAPVLVVRDPALPAERLLVATDLSTAAGAVYDRALRVVEALAPGAEPEVRALLVVMEGMTTPAPARDAVERSARADLSAFLAERPPRRSLPQPVLRLGLPAAEIVAEADRWEADLVVLGTHNRPALPRFLLGSVAESALRHLHGNVLVVPPGCTAITEQPEAIAAAAAGAGPGGIAPKGDLL